MTREEQEKMRQSIEKEQENKSTPNSVTVMFHDRQALLGACDSFFARVGAARLLSDTLTGDLFIPATASPLPSHLKVSASRAHARHRTRRRSLPHIEKYYAEGPIAHSALAVLAVNPNSRSQIAAATIITTMTEQRRCAAA